ncbi:MAG TPA: polysaccharide biosynthesis/export family protein [Chitinispirillaceae bacterium]|nr:polysaccharide biosynthesis/export family protein [Chitinispirillaceae bacterium]
MSIGSFIVQSVLCLASCTLMLCSPKTIQRTNDLNTVKSKGSVMNIADAVEITVPMDDSSFLNGIYPIDDRGYAFIPIIGPVLITGQTTDSLNRLIRSELEQYMHYPEFQIRPLIRASLQGGFRIPGFFYIEPEYSLWELIAKAGGTTSEKGLKKVVWERNNQVISNNIIPLIESGKSLESIGFRSGDQLYTPVDTRGAGQIFVGTILPILTFVLSMTLGVIAITTD